MACFGFFSLYDVQLCFNCIISSHMVDPIEIVYVCLYYWEDYLDVLNCIW